MDPAPRAAARPAELTRLTINVQVEHIVFHQFGWSSRNVLLYQDVSQRLEQAGFEQPPAQCREHIKHWQLLYRTAEDSNSRSERAGPRWPFYEQLDQVLPRISSTDTKVALDLLLNPIGLIVGVETDEGQGGETAGTLGFAPEEPELREYVVLHLCPKPSAASETRIRGCNPPTNTLSCSGARLLILR